jgi:outer membrane protein OmpA-like peptidoglycan-associated protein
LIEADLKARADEALNKAGLTWAKTDFEGRRAVISGRAPEEDEPGKALALVRGTWGVRAILDRSELLEKVANYRWTAAVRDRRLQLTGYVPNDGVRKSILGIAKANLPGRKIDDQMRTARGAPDRDTWLGGINFALTQLAHLKGGEVDIDGTSLSVAGVADNFAAYKAIKSALASNLPRGIKLKLDKVAPPKVSPYTWSARREADKLTLTGHVPNAQQRQRIFTAAKQAYPRAAIIDRMEIADGAPATYAAATQLALTELARLVDGHADLKDAQLSVVGMAETDEVANAVKSSLSGKLPSGMRLSETIRFRAVAVPTVSPYTTSIDAAGSVIVIDGFAPSEQARTALAETVKARFPRHRIDNRMKVAHGAPKAWQTCLQAGLAGIGRIGGGTVSLYDRRIEIAGTTSDEAAYRALGDEMRRAAGDACESASRVVYREPPEPNLKWTATRTADRIMLEGWVPDAQSKSDIARAAARLFPGQRIDDRTVIGGGSGRRWHTVAVHGLELLSRLMTGSARIDGQELTISGEAGADRVVADVRQNLAAGLAKGYRAREVVNVRAVASAPPPAPPDNAAELARRRAAEEARRRAEAEQARRRIEAEAERRRAEAEARLRAEEDARRKADVEAERRSREAKALVARRQVEAERCQTEMRAAARAGTILFQRASADLDRRSQATIAALARAANKCPEYRVEIEGHTDAEGTVERNKNLSERRARAVLERLEAAGVNPARLTAVGYGEQRPIAPNDTAENRAKNRRIEFTVRPPQ